MLTQTKINSYYWLTPVHKTLQVISCKLQLNEKEDNFCSSVVEVLPCSCSFTRVCTSPQLSWTIRSSLAPLPGRQCSCGIVLELVLVLLVLVLGFSGKLCKFLRTLAGYLVALAFLCCHYIVDSHIAWLLALTLYMCTSIHIDFFYIILNSNYFGHINIYFKPM